MRKGSRRALQQSNITCRLSLYKMFWQNFNNRIQNVTVCFSLLFLQEKNTIAEIIFDQLFLPTRCMDFCPCSVAHNKHMTVTLIDTLCASAGIIIAECESLMAWMDKHSLLCSNTMPSCFYLSLSSETRTAGYLGEETLLLSSGCSASHNFTSIPFHLPLMSYK